MEVLSELEMVRLYRHALKPRMQIRILSEINQIPVEEVIKILEAHGCDIARKGRRKGRKKAVRWEADKRVTEKSEAFYKAFERLTEGMSQAKVSRGLKISEGTISRWLNRKGLPSRKSYEKILKYAGKESEEFLNETEIHDPS